MEHERGSRAKTIFTTVLMVFVSLTLIGIVSADCNMMDNQADCPQMAAGNGTFYGPGMMGAGGIRMMESVEISAMGGSMHDEMQGLVTRMMAGSLNSTDQARMVEIMNKYPGASNMMMTRMMGGNGQGWSGYPGMMGGTGQDWNGYPGMMGGYGATGGAGMMNTGFMSLGVILVVLFFVVWLVVGILAIIWLVKQLQKDKVPS